MKKNASKNFIKHFVIIGSGTAINMILGLLTTPIITRIIDPVEYGKLSIFTMYSNIALLVLCLGLDQALVRYYYDNEDIKYKKKLLFKCIKLPVIISSMLTLIVILCSAFNIIKFEFDTLIMILLCFYTIIQIMYRFSTAIVRLEYNSKLYSKLNIFLKLFYIIIALPLVTLVRGNYLLLLVIATVVSAFICLIISIVAQIKIWNFFDDKDNKIDILSERRLLKYAYPYIISMSITTLFQAIDKISLNYYYSYAEVGIYSSTMSLVHIFAIIQTTFNTLWMPMAIENYTKDPDNKEFYQKGNKLITVIMFFIGTSLILVKDLFSILLGIKYREAAYILPFLIFSPIMYTISETTVGGLVFKEKSKLQVIVAIGACITNAIGNVILVPSLGCQGAAISTGISYIVFFTLRTILANKYYYVDFKLKRFYTLTIITVAYALYNTFYSFSIVSIIYYFIWLAILIILYKDIINTMLDYVIKFLTKLRNKKGGA